MRIATGILIALAIFLTLNFISVRTLLLAHPGKRSLIWFATILGNLMWALLPFILAARTTPIVRMIRAVMAPPWFGWLLFIILYSGLAFLVGAAWLAFGRRVPFGRFAQIPSSVFLLVGAILTIIGIFQALVPLRVERVPITIQKLPERLRGYRIAVISDLHVGLFTRMSRLRQISARVRQLEPNLLAITGDMLDDDPYFIPKFLRGLEDVAPQTKMFAVLGNHEIYGDPKGVIAGLKGTRVDLLVNRGVLLPEGIWIAGISDYAAGTRGRGSDLAPDPSAAIAEAPAGVPIVLLSHQPRAFAPARGLRIPLTICGHTHGGQCGIRPLRWSVAGLFLPYHMGLYERDGSQLYVNTGTGHWVLPFRLGMTPEITLIELTPQVSSRAQARDLGGGTMEAASQIPRSRSE